MGMEENGTDTAALDIHRLYGVLGIYLPLRYRRYDQGERRSEMSAGEWHECPGCGAFVTITTNFRKRPFLVGFDSAPGEYCGGCDDALFISAGSEESNVEWLIEAAADADQGRHHG